MRNNKHTRLCKCRGDIHCKKRIILRFAHWVGIWLKPNRLNRVYNIACLTTPLPYWSNYWARFKIVLFSGHKLNKGSILFVTIVLKNCTNRCANITIFYRALRNRLMQEYKETSHKEALNMNNTRSQLKLAFNPELHTETGRTALDKTIT